MACSSCASGGCSSGGCGKKGGCSNGGCNRVNTYDWLSDHIAPGFGPQTEFDIVEVSFKQGAHKEFFRKPHSIHVEMGDFVAVEASSGYDIGHITLKGELVKMQMKRKRVRENTVLPSVLRSANERDMERLAEARAEEQRVMVRARAIARSLNLDMKIGDVEFQGDKRKATFYYTADGRVDFRELIRQFAKEFHVRIEMRQIGARQESARLGGLGPCGRELCCSTWLSDFKTVSTAAARYQNLAINQSKLSGQCGRLKCCLNYEMDVYVEAFKKFPKNADRLYTENGMADLIKTDIFKRLLYYSYREQPFTKVFALSVDKVKEFLAENAKGNKVAIPLEDTSARNNRGGSKDETSGDYVDVTGEIELKPLPKNKKNKNKNRGDKGDRPQGNQQARPERRDRPDNRPKQGGDKPEQKERNENRPPRQDRPDNRPKQGGDRPEQKNRNENRPPRQDRPDNRPKQGGDRPEQKERNDNRPPRQDRPDNRPKQGGDRPEQKERNDNRPPRQDRPEQKERNENRPPRQDRPDNRPKQGGDRPEQKNRNENNRPPRQDKPDKKSEE